MGEHAVLADEEGMIERCRTCLYPRSKPDLHFDETGECAACRNYKARSTIDWDARHQELLRVLDQCAGRVIVASSAGKDSTYICLRLKELGADVTAVTATTCQLTKIGRANIDNLARHVRTIEVTPNMTVRAILNRLAMRLVGDPSWAEHVSIHRVPFQVAYEKGIHAIFYGEAPNNQYGGPPGTEGTQHMTQRWASEFAGFLGLRAQDFIDMEGITEAHMRDYQAPTDDALRMADVTAHFLGYYEPWDSWRNCDVASTFGFRYESPGPMNWWPFENQDSLQTGIHDYLMFRKFCYGRGAAQISVDVRAGKVTRERALAWVEKCDGLLPDPYCGEPLSAVLDHIGMTRAEFDEVVRQFTRQSC